MKFEIGKTYKTRGTGGLVKLITRLENGINVLVWNEVGTDGIYQTNEDGGFYSDGEPSKFDVLPPKQTGTFSVNIYYNGTTWARAFGSRAEAEAATGLDRIACVDVQWEEGQGL